MTVRLERISTRWRLRKRVRGRVVRSIRCSDRRPRVRRTTLVRKGRTRCSLGIRTLFTSSTGHAASTCSTCPSCARCPPVSATACG